MYVAAFRELGLWIGDRYCDGRTRLTPRSSCYIGKGGLMGHALRRVLVFVVCVGCGVATLRAHGRSHGSIGSFYAAHGRSGFGI